MFEPNRETAVQKNPIADGQFNERNSGSWVCKVVGEDASDRQMPVTNSPLVIGADKNCNLVLKDPAVSGKHASVRLTPKGIEVKDLGSTNGVYIRTSKVESILVTSRTIVTLGTTKLEITAPPQFRVEPSKRTRFGSLVGTSENMREVFAIMELAGLSDATVVIEGESGTGKELAARAIHDHSKRAHKPFVVVDCAGVPEQLIESQLFGHREGAFTGAVRSRQGAFVMADGGTIFLDELGELPLAAQAKLLRVLEAHTVQPIGEDRTIRVDVRVIAATNRNLQRMVETKDFRFDLFHRLSVVHFQMTSLREHLEDLSVLIKNFYEGRGISPGNISGSGLHELEQYDWPGNVRELRNVLERAWVLAGPSGTTFENLKFHLGQAKPQYVLPSIDTEIPFKEAKEKWNDVFEKRYVETVFAENKRNISKAAAHSGLNRNHFRKLLHKHELIKE